jgi:uncharacterized membrane protein
MMKKAIGCALVLAGLGVAVWAGVWWAFVGGVVQVVEAIKADPVSGVDIALGALRVLFAGAIGGATAIVAIFPGYAMLHD